MMLLGAGVDMRRADNRLAVCVARQTAHVRIEALLLRVTPGPTACPDRVLPPPPAQ
jgi:hypothetical protein